MQFPSATDVGTAIRVHDKKTDTYSYRDPDVETSGELDTLIPVAYTGGVSA